ncbi:NADPH:quinone oxidoreductase family protein [Ottowia thiooxydans]|uniref:NADPH:quinone oxidoreductase family protein n=1 Tax=Ottowia thiooxydans TaxID=219182 RepID=UPI000412D087|nr:NADPH:quinone oxidoreductase family protein [Ottowia thiooxydans]
MKAVVCRQWGLPELLVVDEISPPVPGPGQVLIEVHAAGVNFPDTLIIQRKYQVQPELPFSPGGEVAGRVKALGPGVSGWSVGDRVVGSATFGGFAQEAVIAAERVVPIPEGMDYSVAAAFVLAYGTTLHALKDRGRLAANETLLVLGAGGGVGIAAVEIGKAMGARVIAAASDAGKLELCTTHGADAVINYTTEDLRERIKELAPNGIDVIFDPVGGERSEAAFRCMAWEGRHLVVGFAAGEVPRLALNLPLLKGASIVGVYWGNFLRRDAETTRAHMRDLFALYASGSVHPPVTRSYRMEEAGQALRDVMERRVKGKVVILTR